MTTPREVFFLLAQPFSEELFPNIQSELPPDTGLAHIKSPDTREKRSLPVTPHKEIVDNNYITLQVASLKHSLFQTLFQTVLSCYTSLVLPNFSACDEANVSG